MKLRSLCASLVALLVVAGMMFPLAAKAGDKRKVAILPFEYGAVTANVGTVDVGKGIVSMLITKLVQDGTYSVIDRQMLDSILKEQNFSVSDRADQSTACKIGKLLSVDAIIVGTVSQFGVEHHSSSVSVPGVAGYIPYAGGALSSLGSLHHRSADAKVAIEARLIDINTGEILATATGTGESKTKGNWHMSADWDWNSSDFTTSVAGEAVVAAVDQLVGQLDSAATKIPDNQSLAAANVQGKVADVTGNTIIINVGKKNGVKVGDNLKVERVTKQVKDPTSGKVIKEITSAVAILNITDADADTATGTILKGAGARVGDLVKKVASTEVSAIVLTPLGGSAAKTK
ncbi:MAG TPA: CsgG/HfaB family protein [Candidatus Obscuribacterales bacterium]